MKETAKEFYAGRRGNCAQAVAFAHAAKTAGESDIDEALGSFAACGGGRAPGGLCGALHAALEIAGPDRAGEIKDGFGELSGGKFSCRDIREGRAMSCHECVGAAAQLLGRRQAG